MQAICNLWSHTILMCFKCWDHRVGVCVSVFVHPSFQKSASTRPALLIISVCCADIIKRVDGWEETLPKFRTVCLFQSIMVGWRGITSQHSNLCLTRESVNNMIQPHARRTFFHTSGRPLSRRHSQAGTWGSRTRSNQGVVLSARYGNLPLENRF